MSYAYNQKNNEDYEANTVLLNKALLEIQNNKKLKASIAQLSSITGLHRNTISKRIEIIQKLEQIKESRKVEKLSRDDPNDKQDSLQEKLANTRIETIYWFNEYQDTKLRLEHSDMKYQKMKESRDYYKKSYEDNKKLLLAAEVEIEKLKKSLALIDLAPNQLRH